MSMKNTGSIFLTAAALLCLLLVLAVPKRAGKSAKQGGPDLEVKLARKADFVPSDKSALDRIVAIAKHYEIPMGIEWMGGAGAENLEVPASALPANCTVRDLLTAIVSRLPDYQLTVQNGVVHLAPPVIAVRNDNFLNLVIEDFEVKDDSLFGADHELHIAIYMTLHPEVEGYAGGYGHDPEHVFARRNLSYESHDLTVRQILDGLAKANGNALWIAEFDRKDFASQPKSNTTETLKDTVEEPKREWRFVPFRD
ncbi:MAG TPA: hypothetical protein VJR02_21485 [Pyrinomonadaceae bacterium]|nr:hypothetical protein [Pyrinomonadaceae bacterium]